MLAHPPVLRLPNSPSTPGKPAVALSDRIPYQAQVDRPKLTLPDGKKLAVWVILNVEEWRIENAMPRTVLSPPMGQPLLPDVPNWSWHEYGMRAGFWRQFKALTERKMPVTLAINANVCISYPRVASAALEAGFEFMGHGFVQGPMHKVENQADAIKRSVETISKFAGKASRSWESPGLTETEETLDLLRLNGIEYVADWVIDDLPQDIATPHGTITTIPYSVETNDIVIHALQHLPSEQFLKRCTDQFDRLYLEGASNARIMAISIHPYITGVPHRIKYLEALLDYVIGHDGVALMTASEIGDWYAQRWQRSKLRSTAAPPASFGDHLRGPVAVSGNKPAEAAARKQQRLLPIIGVGFDGAQENDVVATVVPIGRTALEIGYAVGQHRRIAKAWRPIHTGELVIRRFRKLRRQCFLGSSENIDGEMARILEDREPLGKHPKTPQYQRRIERYRGKGVAGYAIRPSICRHRRDDGDARGERAKCIAEVPGIDRRVVAGKFIGRIGRMFGCVRHPPGLRASDFRTAGQAPRVHSWFQPHRN